MAGQQVVAVAVAEAVTQRCTGWVVMVMLVVLLLMLLLMLRLLPHRNERQKSTLNRLLQQQ